MADEDIGDVPSLLGFSYARDNLVVVILTMYTRCGYWLRGHVTTGVGAQTPYSNIIWKGHHG